MPRGADGQDPGAADERRAHRMTRATFAAKAATIAILIVAGAEWGVRTWAAAVEAPALLGLDIHFYLERTASWLAGTGFYQPWQLTGQPYLVERGAVTYPPTVLLLFTPFTLGLPMVLWWAVPLGAIGAVLIRSRPPAFTWPLLALVLVYPRTWVVVALGNPSIWAIAAGVAGTAWGWPAAFAVLKPAFAPLALVGIRWRSFWIAVAMLVAVSIPFGSMWSDYLTAIRSATTDRGLEYLLGEWPIALVLIVAVTARSRGPLWLAWMTRITGRRERPATSDDGEGGASE